MSNNASPVDQDALAQRMARLLGMPTASIQVLLPLIPEAELAALTGLSDDNEFLKASTRLIQKAQAEQFIAPAAGAEPAAEEAAKADTTIRTKAQTHAAAPAAPQAPAAEEPPPAEEAPAAGDSDSLVNRLPSVFHRAGANRNSPEEKKKFLLMLIGAGALGLILIGAGIWLMLKIFADTPAAPADGGTPPGMVEGGGGAPPPPDAGLTGSAPREFKNQFAWQLDTGLALEVPRPDLLTDSEDGSSTVEYWFKPAQVANLVGLNLVIHQDGGAVLALRAQRDEGGLMITFEAPALAAAAAQQKLTRLGDWVHLAGVYDAAAQKLSLYIGGRLAASTPSNPEAEKPAAGGYVISTEVDGPECQVLLDEVRLSTTARYKEPFKPSRLLQPGPGVVSLLHLEQWEDNQIYDAAYEQLSLPLPGGSMVDIQEDLKVALPPEKLTLPAEVLAMLEGEGLSKDEIARFVREWNALSDAKKREWLSEAGFGGDAQN